MIKKKKFVEFIFRFNIFPLNDNVYVRVSNRSASITCFSSFPVELFLATRRNNVINFIKLLHSLFSFTFTLN